MRKIYILILSLFVFISPINAEEIDYSKLEIREVEELPGASEEYTNVLYKYNGKYYISELQDVTYTPTEIGDNLAGQTLYFNFDIDEFKTLTTNIDNSFLYINSSNNITKSTRFSVLNNGTFYRVQFTTPSSITLFLYENETVKTNLSSYTFSSDSDLVVSGIRTDAYYHDILMSMISKTPFEKYYDWVVIPNNLVEKVEEKDFYLFFDFDTISSLDIFSFVDFSTFSDFEKLNIVLLFNIFFGIFIFLIIYISLKGLYKFISMIN